MGSVLSKNKSVDTTSNTKRTRDVTEENETQPAKIQRTSINNDNTNNNNNNKNNDLDNNNNNNEQVNQVEEGKKNNNSKRKKRHQSGKERREHFEKNKTWKAEDSKDKKQNNRPSNPENSNKEPRYPKKKVALLIGYCGTGYQGLQFNPGANTLEKEIFEALVRANAISQMNSDNPNKVHWVRAARTDKGVHAAGNVISLKIQFPKSPQEMLEAINQELPEKIRIWGMVDVIRSFHAKTACDSRVYEYLLPSYAFSAPLTKEARDQPLHDNDMKIYNHDGSITKYIPRLTEDEIKERETYRISTDQLNLFREALNKYQGTHNFHNYTIGRSANDKSTNRYIMDITVDEPIYINNVEWLSVKLHGQAFMLHQIRKMISLAVLIVRSGTPLSLIDQTFEHNRINIPKAPAIGLLLERPVFTSYNNRIKDPRHTVEHDPIDYDIYKETINEFKQKWIYSNVFDTEKEERGFDNFLASIDNSFTNDFKYLNPEGIIPEECLVVTKYNE
ncbi:pseudouridine synthase [Cunninghamella echinulata]|nr:pseudouridine synthase [Cunninghamella echinulata]